MDQFEGYIPQGLKPDSFWSLIGTTEVVPFHDGFKLARCLKAVTLDFAAALAVVCLYTGKEVDPAYEQRFFEL